MALAAPVSAKDVYVTTVEVAASRVQIYAMDETIGVNGNIYGVMTKAVYPNGNRPVFPVRRVLFRDIPKSLGKVEGTQALRRGLSHILRIVKEAGYV